VETQGDEHHFAVEVLLKNISPATVRVELYADGDDGEAHHAAVSSDRPATDYTARIDTSMMFMMPMPPTSKETAATP